MSAENEVPDYYCNDREFLLGVLEDRNEEWEKLREDAYDAARLDLDGVIQPSEEVQEFLRLRDREIIERAARRLLGLGERRKVMGVLEQQLSDIAQLGEWLGRTTASEVSSANIVFQRACNVARWLLNAKLRELEKLKIDAVDLAKDITELEGNLSDDEARKRIGAAQRLLTNCLPLPRNELAAGVPGRSRQPKPIPAPEEGAGYALVITADGFRILDKNGRTRHVVHLPKRLRRLLLAAWACGWVAQNLPLERGDDDPGLNAPVNPSFAISSLRRLLGKSANRTDHCTLRKYLRRADGPCLISEGRSRMSLVDFRVDTAGKAPGETLRAYLYRVLEEHDIQSPRDPPGSVKPGVNNSVKWGVNLLRTEVGGQTAGQ